MIEVNNIGDVYTLTNPYAGLPPMYVGESTRCKFRHNTPVKAAKAKKKAKSKRRMIKQSKINNR